MNASAKGRRLTEKLTPKKQPKRRNRVRNWAPTFLRHLSAYGNVTEAAKKAKVTRQAVYQRRETDQAFAEVMDDAIKLGCIALEDEARRRAYKGCDEGVFYKGRKVAKLIKYSDTLLIFLLKAHKPEVYRETMRHEHVDWAAIVKTWTDAQLLAYRQGVPLPTVLAMGLTPVQRAVAEL
jgi:hypothetical protein